MNYCKKIIAVFLCLLVFVTLSGCKQDISAVYTDGMPNECVTIDKISQVRFALPVSIVEKQMDIANISTDTTVEQLQALGEAQYLTRYENYGMIMSGPDLFCMVVRDGSLFETELSSVQYGDMVQYILQDEVELGNTIAATSGTIDAYTDETENTTKIICPITMSSYNFSGLEYSGPFYGYAALIQKEDDVSAVCIAVSPNTSQYNKNDLDKQNKDIVKSFRLDTNKDASYYTIYGNTLPGFSYDSGGLLSYEGYAYSNLGTDKMDNKGTYNKLSDQLGMYCLNTSFGALNLPYLLTDVNLFNEVVDDGTKLYANILSSNENLMFQVTVHSWDEKDFDTVLYDMRNEVQKTKTNLAESFGYDRQAVVSEDITENSEAVITLCGWDEDTAENTVVYYKLSCSKFLYSVTKIVSTQELTDEISPLLKEIAELSGLTLD